MNRYIILREWNATTLVRYPSDTTLSELPKSKAALEYLRSDHPDAWQPFPAQAREALCLDIEGGWIDATDTLPEGEALELVRDWSSLRHFFASHLATA